MQGAYAIDMPVRVCTHMAHTLLWAGVWLGISSSINRAKPWARPGEEPGAGGHASTMPRVATVKPGMGDRVSVGIGHGPFIKIR